MVTRINLLFSWDNLLFIRKLFIASQIFQRKNVGFVRQECQKKKKKQFSQHIFNTWFHNKCAQPLGNDYNLISQTIVNCFCQSDFDKCVTLSQTNESAVNNNNQKEAPIMI